MFSAFISGFFIGLSLIVAIGPQNAYLIRQGLLKQNVFAAALFCSMSDIILIIIGITGVTFFSKKFFSDYYDLLILIASIWLSLYGLMKLKNAIFGNYAHFNFTNSNAKLKSTLIPLAIITFGNPHVYLDTVVLIGSFSQKFPLHKAAYGLGASLASLIFFFSLAYAASLFSQLMQSKFAWRFLDGTIALIMFALSYKIASGSSLIL